MQKNSRAAQGRDNTRPGVSARKPLYSRTIRGGTTGERENDTNGNPFELLAIDDDPVDRRLLARVFAEVSADVSVRFCDSGSSALELLTQRDGAGRLYRPDACICDINMRGISGIDFLKRAKGEEALRRIPIVMLSSSDDARDMRQCYDLQAASYVCKPPNYTDLCSFVSGFAHYWVEIVSVPARPNVKTQSASK